MTHIFKFSAVAAAALFTAVPAYSAAHLNINSMTCEEYNELSGADRDAVAASVIQGMNEADQSTIAPNNGTATATEAPEGTHAEESPAGSQTTIAANNGTAMATSSVSAGDHASRFVEEARILNRTCARNWDTMVSEAVAGQGGTR